MLAYRPSTTSSMPSSSSNSNLIRQSTHSASSSTNNPPALAKRAHLPIIEQSQPLQPLLPTKTRAITKLDKGKLTEAWGSPPVIIQREPGCVLTRGDLLGEVILIPSC